MPDWQERITRETPPQIRLEHVVRYAAAAPLVADNPWCDLGCGTGLAAEEAGLSPSRALLIDVDDEVATEAASRFPNAEALGVRLDLSREEGVQFVREQTGDWHGTCITCFELIEHLDNFVPLVGFLIERAEA